jgi:ribulose-5-phosphate 4-epimerase/fuculose-1-phosphate aldolase
MLFTTLHEAAQLSFTIERLNELGVNLYIDGAISVLDDEDNIWITPNYLSHEADPELEMLMFTEKDIENQIEDHRFLSLHQSIYKTNSAIRSIIQVSSIEVIASSSRINYGMFHALPLFRSLIGTISIEELNDFTKVRAVKAIQEDVKDDAASIILKNYGLICTAIGLEKALFKLENILHILRIFASTPDGKYKAVSTERMDAVSSFEPEQFVSLRGRKSHFDFTPFQNQLQNLMKAAIQSKWITANTGSFSVRVNEDSYFISTAHVAKSSLNSESYMLVRGEKIEANKQVDPLLYLHHGIINKLPNVNAIAIIHPIHLTALEIGTNHIEFTNPHPFYNFNGRLISLPYDSIINPQMIIDQLSLKQDGIVIENFGLLVIGKTVHQVLQRIETLENLARLSKLK